MGTWKDLKVVGGLLTKLENKLVFYVNCLKNDNFDIFGKSDHFGWGVNPPYVPRQNSYIGDNHSMILYDFKSGKLVTYIYAFRKNFRVAPNVNNVVNFRKS